MSTSNSFGIESNWGRNKFCLTLFSDLLLVAWLEQKSSKSFRTELSILSQKVEYNVENEENRVENKEDERRR